MTGYLLVAATVLFTVFGQLVIKWQVTTAGPLPAAFADKLQFLAHLLLNPWIIAGLLSAFAASLTWMLALSKLPLTVAYPFTAFSFVIVVLGGGYLFSEPVGLAKVAGLCLIVVGITLTSLK